MNTLHSYKARDFGGTVVEDLRITFDQPLPDSQPDVDLLEEWQQWYRAEAHRLVDAMRTTLPGGLIDALLVELLRVKACVLGVTL
jgi:hypothetical protein